MVHAWMVWLVLGLLLAVLLLQLWLALRPRAGGNATARTLVIDTGVVLVNGTGSINLGAERMDFRLDGETKEPRLFHLWSDILVNGPIRNPSLGVDGGGVAAQVGVAGLLGALVNPIAAILPFVDPGLADDADCGALIASAG